MVTPRNSVLSVLSAEILSLLVSGTKWLTASLNSTSCHPQHGALYLKQQQSVHCGHYCKPAPSTKLPLSNNLHHDMSITVIQTICLSVMQTLMDPERRATYDALAGFSANSINPFADATLPADQVR